MNIETLNQKITLGQGVVITHDYTIRGGVNEPLAEAVRYERLRRSMNKQQNKKAA